MDLWLVAMGVVPERGGNCAFYLAPLLAATIPAVTGLLRVKLTSSDLFFKTSPKGTQGPLNLLLPGSILENSRRWWETGQHTLQCCSLGEEDGDGQWCEVKLPLLTASWQGCHKSGDHKIKITVS